jgi:hypothetical protein
MIVLLLVSALLLAACGHNGAVRAEPTVTLPQGVVAAERCGGFDDRARTTTVYSSGIVEMRKGRHSDGPLLHSTRVPVADVRELYKVLRSREWQRLDASFGEVIPDGTGCTTTGAGKTVSTETGERPEVLNEVARRFSQMERRALEVAFVIRKGPRAGTRSRTVHEDGTVKLWAGRWSESTVIGLKRLPPAELADFNRVMGSSAWLGLEKRYGSADPDAPGYTIIASQKAVRAEDGVAVPPSLGNILARVDKLWSEAERAKVWPVPTGTP